MDMGALSEPSLVHASPFIRMGNGIMARLTRKQIDAIRADPWSAAARWDELSAQEKQVFKKWYDEQEKLEFDGPAEAPDPHEGISFVERYNADGTLAAYQPEADAAIKEFERRQIAAYPNTTIGNWLNELSGNQYGRRPKLDTTCQVTTLYGVSIKKTQDEMQALGKIVSVCLRRHGPLMLESFGQLRDELAKKLGVDVYSLSQMTIVDFAAALDPHEPHGAAREVVKCPLTIDGKKVLVHGKPIALRMTEDRAEDALTFLTAVINKNGNWISSSEINKQEEKKPNKGRSGVRWDRIYKALPADIRIHIDKKPGKGFCLLEA